MTRPRLQGNDALCFVVQMLKPHVSAGTETGMLNIDVLTLKPGCQRCMAHRCISFFFFLIYLRKELMRPHFKTDLPMASVSCGQK